MSDHLRGVAAAACLRASMTLALGLAAGTAPAFELKTGDPDLKLRWDTTLKYSTALRLNDASPALTGPAQINLDDGDRNFATRGLVSNRLDLFSEADLVWRERQGLRLSVAGWYDAVYDRGNKNDAPQTVNIASEPAGRFSAATRRLMGRDAELMDAFVFGAVDIGDMTATARLGRHAQVWGETLFFGANGIAGGMVPIDYVKLFSVPGSQFKEVMRPVNQVSGQLQVRPGLTLGGYYQFEWEPNRIPASGAYSSFSDIYGKGRERLYWGSGAHFDSAGNVRPRSGGQYGLQLRWRPAGLDADIGFYALRYHQKDPNALIRPSAGAAFFANPGSPGERVGDYALAYHEGTRVLGTSLSTTVGDANVGLEASVRHNAALVNAGSVVLDPGADNRSNPAYPVGRTAHVNASMVLLLPPGALWQGGTLLAEVGWNRLLSVSRNPAGVDRNATRDAFGLRMILAPSYYQVLDGLDVSVPIGLGWNPRGRSSAVSLFNGGVDRGGDFSIGVVGDYRKRLTFSLTYTTYLGSGGAVLVPSNDALSYRQYYKDRRNLSASLQASF